jgi:hypothetical protein
MAMSGIQMSQDKMCCNCLLNANVSNSYRTFVLEYIEVFTNSDTQMCMHLFFQLLYLFSV